MDTDSTTTFLRELRGKLSDALIGLDRLLGGPGGKPEVSEPVASPSLSNSGRSPLVIPSSSPLSPESPFTVSPDPAPVSAPVATPVAMESVRTPAPELLKSRLRVALIVGHEPTKPGAQNPGTGLSEFAFNDKLANGVASRVAAMSEGAIELIKVHRAPYSLSQLPGRINDLAPAFGIEMHANASDGSGNGTEVIHHPGSQEGMRLAQCVQDRFLQALELRDRGIKTPWAGRGAGLLAGTSMPVVIAEPFFIDHEGDFSTAMARVDRLAAAYALAILDYARDLHERGLWV